MDSFDWGEADWYNLDNKDLEYHYFKYEPDSVESIICR